jgi:hypothetical protein
METKAFEIGNYYNESKPLLEEDEVIYASTGRMALDKYLKENNINVKVKVSGDDFVHFCVTPIVFIDGKKYLDTKRRRQLWYQIIF